MRKWVGMIAIGIIYAVLLSSCADSSSGNIGTEASTASMNSNLSTEPAAEPETEPKEETYSVFVTSANLNVRSGVGTSYDVLYTSQVNEQLQMTGNEDKTKSGTIWYEVITPDTHEIGWCCSKYGTVEETTGFPIKINYAKIEREKKKRERDENLRVALSKLKADKDEVKQVTFYEPSTMPKYIDSRTYLLPYFAYDGKSSPTFRIKYNYCGNDWIFWTKIIFAVDDVRYTKEVGYFDPNRDVSSAKVVERLDEWASLEEKNILRKIVDSKKTIIRFEGDDYHYDLIMNEADKKAIGEVFTAYDLLRYDIR